MAVSIPFLTSETHYTLTCPIDDQSYLFDVRWNSRDEAWYFDMYQDDNTPVAINVKVVIGAMLGRRSRHAFFDSHKLIATDTTGQGVDPGYDDLNSRVLVVVQSVKDFVF